MASASCSSDWNQIRGSGQGGTSTLLQDTTVHLWQKCLANDKRGKIESCLAPGQGLRAQTCSGCSALQPGMCLRGRCATPAWCACRQKHGHQDR